MERLIQYCVFFLAIGYTTFSTAAEITLGDGRTLNTDLMEGRLVAVLHSDNGDEFALIAGRDCIECDENTSLYVTVIGNPVELHHLVYDENHKLIDDRNEYPGKLSDYLTGNFVRDVKTYYGKCLGSDADSVVWFVSFMSKTGSWVTGEDALKLHGKLSTHDVFQTSQPDLKQVLLAKRLGRCYEIAGIDGPTEP